MQHKMLCAAGRAAVRVSAVAILLLLIAALVCGVMLYVRYRQQQGNQGAVATPAVAWGDEPAQTGRFDATLRFTDLLAPGSGEISTSVTWDDGWFFDDASAYNAELAHTAAVISTLAYSESGYYQQHSSQPAYMELALAELGFSDVSTESYRYRSEVVDEALSLVTQTADVAAYAIATKTLAAPAGAGNGVAETDVILVSVRGSYGSEWLSNLEVLFDQGDDAQQADRDIADAMARAAGPDCEAGTEDDHPGYTQAAEEICGEVARRVEAAHRAGRSAQLLVVGHSRGGAIANLVAAEACDALAGVGDAAERLPLEPGDGVRAYTFATPATTTSDDVRDARYAGIFNVLNTADIMVHLPLQSWGYERFGTDVELPALGDAGFEAAFTQMNSLFEQMMGVACPLDADAEATVRDMVDDLSERFDSVEALTTPAGVAQVFGILAEHVDPLTILNPHYPSVYIAWLASLGK